MPPRPGTHEQAVKTDACAVRTSPRNDFDEVLVHDARVGLLLELDDVE